MLYATTVKTIAAAVKKWTIKSQVCFSLSSGSRWDRFWFRTAVYQLVTSALNHQIHRILNCVHSSTLHCFPNSLKLQLIVVLFYHSFGIELLLLNCITNDEQTMNSTNYCCLSISVNSCHEQAMQTAAVLNI